MNKVGIIIAVSLSILSVFGCSMAGKPKYPTPPNYPAAQNIEHEELEQGQVRVTSFTTNDDAERIFSFYHDKLLEQGWHLNQQEDNHVAYGYINGSDNPAFTLGITVQSTQDESNIVEIRQAISGPFIWREP